jgi:hypothetical protein
MLVTVSRPASVQSGVGGGFEDEVGLEMKGKGMKEEKMKKRGEGEEEEDREEGGDSRSIQSFQSMIIGKRKQHVAANAKSGRKSLSDRLAHMSGFSRLQSKGGCADKVRPCLRLINTVMISADNTNNDGNALLPTCIAIPPGTSSHTGSGVYQIPVLPRQLRN